MKFSASYYHIYYFFGSSRARSSNRTSKNFRCCEDTLPPLSFLDYQSDEKRISLRDRDRIGNDPQWVSNFPSCCSWMFTKRLRKKSELVGSEEIRRVLTMHPRYETMSFWVPLRVFYLFSHRSLQKLGRCILEPILGHVCSSIDYYWYFQVFLSKLPLISFYS